MKWRRLQLVFGKRKLKSISAVEYVLNGIIIRTTTQVEIEKVVMNENTSQFSLAYSLLIFSKGIIKQLGSKGQTKLIDSLIRQNISIRIEDLKLDKFLSLLY